MCIRDSSRDACKECLKYKDDVVFCIAIDESNGGGGSRGYPGFVEKIGSCILCTLPRMQETARTLESLGASCVAIPCFLI